MNDPHVSKESAPTAAPQAPPSGATAEEEEREERGEEVVVELMGFRVAGEEYGVDIMRIKEITPVFELTPIPRAPAYIRGILSLRGNILPVFDLKRRLGLPEGEASPKARIIVLKNDDEQVGILVDAITSAARIPAASLEPPPPVLRGVEADFVSGVGRFQNRMIVILDIDRVIRVDAVA